jgi:hypothetical protein
MSNTGGPAFPRNILDHGHGVITTHESGMTLRDYFAAKAMQALITRIPMSGAERARDAYIIADAMLKAREQK